MPGIARASPTRDVTPLTHTGNMTGSSPMDGGLYRQKQPLTLLAGVRNQVLHDRRIRKRRRITKVGGVTLGNLAQDPAHDLA